MKQIIKTATRKDMDEHARDEDNVLNPFADEPNEEVDQHSA